MNDKIENHHGLSRRKFITNGLMLSAAAAVPSSLASAIASTSGSELTWMPGWQLVEQIASKKLSPVDVTEHFLKRIDQIDPILRAYITVDHEGARAQAKAAEQAVMRGDKLGPLHGLPISIKDLYMTKGLRTTQGSMAYENTVPEIDELLVERLRGAGAIILGKSQTPEFATFPRTKTIMAGECVNPWNTNHVTGASSGGAAAAVAAGISCFAIASDGGGSTRIPACFNGVFGLQPSAGRIPSRIPKSVQMASAGPTTLHVRDSALMIQVMSGQDPRDPSAIEEASPDFLGELNKGIKDFKIAWSPDLGCVPNVQPEVVKTVESAVKLFSRVGAHIDNPSLLFPDDQAWQVFLTLNETSYQRGGRLLTLSPEEAAKLTPPTQKMLEMVKNSPKVTAKDQIKALELRADVQRWANNIFARYDLLCTPTLGITAPEIPAGEWDQPYTDPYYARHISTSYTYLANILGLPAASVPCGFINGLPVGLQIIGKRFDDVKVMRAAQAFAEIQPWMNKHPALAI